MKKTEQMKEGPPKQKEADKSHELKTEPPLSEKDEVKQAEEKLRRGAKEK